MKKRIAALRLSIVVFAFVVVCAKLARAGLYDTISKLNIFQKGSNEEIIADDTMNPCDYAAGCEDSTGSFSGAM